MWSSVMCALNYLNVVTSFYCAAESPPKYLNDVDKRVMKKEAIIRKKNIVPQTFFCSSNLNILFHFRLHIDAHKKVSNYLAFHFQVDYFGIFGHMFRIGF